MSKGKVANPNDPIFYVYVYLDSTRPGRYVYGEYEFEYLDGPEKSELVLDESQLSEAEQKIYIKWFKGQTRQTTGKIMIYGKY